jgi:hypothetical protein
MQPQTFLSVFITLVAVTTAVPFRPSQGSSLLPLFSPLFPFS